MRTHIRLLLVEDDPEDALLFRKQLPSGYTCEHALGAEQSRALLRQQAFDALFIDYRLGPEDGLSLARSLRAEGCDLPLIVLTGMDIEALGENALLAGASDFLSKASISSESIERATRWSMVRRLVEIRRRKERPLLELDTLLQLQRDLPPPRMGPENGLQRVMYASLARTPLSPQAFLNLCALAAHKNQQQGITGVLVAIGPAFLQSVEGPKDAVTELLEKISRDPRHESLVILDEHPVNRRDFVIWNMGSFAIPRSTALSGKAWIRLTASARELVHQFGSGRDGIAAVAKMLASDES